MKHFFTGRILPERTYLSLPKLFTRIKSRDNNFSANVTINIQVAQVNVIVETESNLDKETLKNTIKQLVHAYVDSYGYLNGRGYELEITSIANDDLFYVFGVQVDCLYNQKEGRLSEMELFKIILRNPLSSLVLSDLRQAINEPISTPFHCYRALEAMSRDVSSETDDKKRWREVGIKLRIDKSYTKEMQDKALPNRHGNYSSITTKERISLLNKTWKVIDRYIIYISDNRNKLDDEKFLLLKGNLT